MLLAKSFLEQFQAIEFLNFNEIAQVRVEPLRSELNITDNKKLLPFFLVYNGASASARAAPCRPAGVLHNGGDARSPADGIFNAI
ncbi:hypothetical protein EVAR_70592_1 [Eumeta japonica]|uniref:Uncharacterized protein n=1 Tax=Eumeta variegata TaxID=151549 RepID=A0A4C2A981_EUMVA|nr:hypothetical protein EVAR_70592_1 [Eumeta japonica]